MTIQKSDRTILVTGGSRGLGLAIVRILLAEGYRVGTCSRNLTDLLRQLLAEPANQERLHWRECEVGDEPSEDKYFHEFMTWSGKKGSTGLSTMPESRRKVSSPHSPILKAPGS